MQHNSTIGKTGSLAPLKNVAICLDVAQRIIDQPNGVDRLGMFYGPSGYGKSKASQYTQNKKEAIYLEVFDYWTRKVFVQSLLEELGIDRPHGTTASMMKQALRLLGDDPNRLLIIDEADKIVDKGYIELVRDIYKGAKIPVLLVGEEKLPEKLKAYERCDNRVTAYGAANACDLDDARTLLHVYHPSLKDAVADDLLSSIVSQTKGNASRIVTTLADVAQFARATQAKQIDARSYSGAIFTGRAPSRRAA